MKLGVRRRVRSGFAASTGMLALVVISGCGQLPPGTATVVNGTRITNTEVADLAKAQCQLRGDLSESQNAPVISGSRVRADSLGLLMDTDLSLQFGKSEQITPDRLLSQAFLGQVEPFFKTLPEQPRGELTDVFSSWADARSVLVQVGARASGQQPSPENVEQLLNAGLAAREPWLKKADITTNARYSPSEEGFPGGSDGSVSRATSDFAKAATSEEPDPRFVSSLPIDQKCG